MGGQFPTKDYAVSLFVCLMILEEQVMTFFGWDDNYRWIKHYATLSEELRVNTFHVMHELHTMGTNESYTKYWRSLIGEVRVSCKG